MIKIRTDINRLPNESYSDYCQRFTSIVTEFETLSDGHIRWFTHKNPYGCWICDLLQAIRQFVTEMANEDNIGAQITEDTEEDSEIEDEVDLEDKYV